MKYPIGAKLFHIGSPVEIIGYAPRFQGHDDYEVRDEEGVEYIIEECMLNEDKDWREQPFWHPVKDNL